MMIKRNDLKHFLESKTEIRLVGNEKNSINTKQSEPSSLEEATDEERKAILRSLRGSLNMRPERIREFEAYLQEIRNELD